ncbi:MAG: ATP-grasp domain-containing protein, partial [Polyangiaceae bacterium]|nr:ATP-grasp domain-containing protein [Polyangiaceae bacterium]
MSQIVLMGHRPGAVIAARRLGLDAQVVVVRGEGEASDRSCPLIELADTDRESLESLAERVRHADAVVGLTERMVVPAARLRALLGLEGTTPAVALRAHDKLFMKEAFRAAGIPCARFLPAGPKDDVDALVEQLGLPLVMKDRKGSGSRGTVLVEDAKGVRAALRESGIAEALVEGEEMSVEAFVFEGEVLFESFTQYLAPFWANVVPAPVGIDVRALLSRTLREVVAAIGATRAMVHLEVFVTPSGILASEVALRPPGGYLMRLVEAAYGFDAWKALLRLELGEAPSVPREPAQVAGVWIFHPGPGFVEAVDGLDEARLIPSVRRLHCTAARGSKLGTRAGSGQAVGSVICVGA